MVTAVSPMMQYHTADMEYCCTPGRVQQLTSALSLSVLNGYAEQQQAV
jgi:hypothetical protein